MINTEKVIGFYTDCFGNEIDEYEEIERYTLCYKGYIFEGDGDGWNSHNYDRWEDVKSVYDFYRDESNGMYIEDNQYGVTFKDGDWY